MKKYFYFLLFSFCFLLIITCTTQPQSGNLTGTVQLAGEADHGGIVIGVYELAELDPDIVEANQNWPHIGVIINQHTEFDHRFGTLVKTGETDASGYFEINDIPTGNYNIVVIKNGYGFRYIYNVQINDGNNSLENFLTEKRKKEKGKSKKADNDEDSSFNLLPLSFNLNKSRADLTLYPETIIYSDITTPTTFESHHHYIIEQDIIVDAELTIEPGAVIRLNEGVKMSIYGDLTAVGQEDNFIWFTSNDSINSSSFFRSPSSDRLSEYKVIELDGTINKEVSFCKFEHAGTGLLNHVNGFSISDCIFRNSSCGFKSECVDSTFCSNLLCENITCGNEGGIYFTNVDSGIIEKNILMSNSTGIKVKDNTNPEISNNYFYLNEFGAELWSSNSSFIHNELLGNIYDLRVCGPTSPEIRLNNFESNIGVYIGYNCIYPNAIPEIHFNNLINCNYAIYGTAFNSITINAENNYFGTTDPLTIEELIRDKNDILPTTPYYETFGIVNYNPFLTQECPHAGIFN